MKRQCKAETVRVMGVRWVWDYTARRWQWNSHMGQWQLWYDGKQWCLKSPRDAIYTIPKQHRYEAMVTAGYKIAEIERWLGR
jgi:hypothetical protein